MVYVINKQGQALMPTERFGKVRRLLKNSLAHVVCRIPFTIQLDYDTTDYTQPVSLGVDAGSKHIGISATTSDKELYAADVELRNDIVDKLSTRREQRRTRRSRLRYRKASFNNRVSSKRKGWLAPSVENKIQTHLTVVEKIHKFLPITKKSWRCAILIIAEKNGSRRFFLGEKGTSDSLRLGFSPNNSNIYSAFKSMDIGTWSCTIMAVAVHGSHPDSNNEAHEISSSTGYKFPIIPECFGYKTKITGVKITTPKKRFFYKVIFIDNSGRGTYIPYDIRVQMVVQDNNNKTLFNPGIKTWGDIERDSISVSGREYIYEENYTIDDGSGKLTGLKCFMTIPDYEEEPGIWETPDLSGSNYSRYIYNQGLHTTELEWDLSSKEVNEFRVSLSYRDSSQ